MIEDYATDELLEALDEFIKELQEGYQRIWLCTGENQVGKSNFCLDICRYVSNQLSSKIWVSFFFKTYYGEEDTIADIRQDLGLEKTNIWPASTQYGQIHGGLYDCHDVDEAVHDLHMGGAMGKEAKKYLRNYDMYGKRRYFNIMIMPEFEFMKSFRNKRSHMWIHIPERGLACFHRPNKTFDEGIPIKTYSATPIWLEHFKPLDPEMKAVYEQIKEYMLSLDARREEQTEQSILKAQLQRFRERFPEATQKDMAYVVDLSQATASRLLSASKT